MHDGMQYDPIQGQGHELLKVGNSAIFRSTPQSRRNKVGLRCPSVRPQNVSSISMKLGM